MQDHDQRFKVLLREFIVEFFLLFYPEWARRFDFARIEWLDQEVFPDPPHGERFAVDLVAKLPVLEPVAMPGRRPAKSWIALLHVEVEGRDKATPLRPRLYDYSGYLRHKHALPVLPIALYLRVGLDGIGWDAYEEFFWEHRLVRFEYPYVGLPALDGEQYLRGDNWLGVALSALMRVPSEKRVVLAAEAYRRLVQCPEPVFRRHLLCECVATYGPVDEAQQQAFEELLLSEPDPGVREMTVSLFDKYRREGLLAGRQEGLREGLREGEQRGQSGLLCLLLENRFGPLSAALRQHLATLPVEKLRELALASQTAQSLEALGLEGFAVGGSERRGLSPPG